MDTALLAPGLPGHNRILALSADLADKGWAILPDWPGTDITSALHAAALAHEQAERTRPAAIGPTERMLLDRETRRARLRWLSRSDAAETAFLERAEAMRLALNAQLYLGLFDFEACHAVYPPGGFYRRHMDSFQGARNRMVSVVTYLNPTWQAADGGALVIYGRDGTRAAEILPEAGLSVFMLSEEIEHEVEPTAALRFAVAGWWRVRPEIH